MEEPTPLMKEEVRLRERQCKCDHPSLKCSLCRLSIDNMCNEQQAEINLLHIILEQLEELLSVHNIEFTSYRHIVKDSIIEEAAKIKLREYISHRRMSE
jgi:hypothetical protein